MGSGKSTIGRLLADATGWPYLDNDELVSRTRGTTAR
ncbi:MAG: shikimate kinase, partial [Candidatus Limnocylindria bacterium]